MIARLLAAILAALLVAAPVVSNAQLLTLGVGPGGFSVATAYTPLGVAYYGNVAIGGPLSTSPLNVTNTKTVLMSWWQWVVRAIPAGGANTLTQSNPFDPIRTNGNVTCEAPGKGVCLANDNTTNKMQLNFSDSTGGGVAHTFEMTGVAGHTVQNDGQWENFILSYDLANSHAAIYRNGVNVGANGGGSGDFAWTFHNITPDWNNTGNSPQGMGLVNSNQTDNSWGWQSDTYVDLSGSAVCTNVNTPATMFGINVTCTQAETIPPEIIAKFYSGGLPVHRAASDCSDVTARIPEICLYGDGSAFATNHGTADSSTGSAATAFSVISIVAGATVYKPAYGPAGPTAHVATLAQFQSNNTSTLCAGTPCTATIDASKITAQLSTGEFAMFAVMSTDASSFFTTGQTFACSSPGSTTWTKTEIFQSGAGHKEMMIVCTGFLAANDLGGSYSVTWQSGALGSRYRAQLFAAYSNVSSVDFQVGTVNNSAVTSQCTPSGHTTANANETIVSIWANFAAQVSHIMTPPATGMTRQRILPSSGTPGQLMLVDENATTEGAPIASGANTQRCATDATADSYEAFTVALVPN